jgi:F0F1-type ATP synthase assembly protein I
VYEQRLLYWSLATAFVIGLAAHVGGYLLKSSVTTQPLGLVVDLLYALGYALWTGVVVAVFPQATRRQGTTKRRRRGSGEVNNLRDVATPQWMGLAPMS